MHHSVVHRPRMYGVNSYSFICKFQGSGFHKSYHCMLARNPVGGGQGAVGKDPLEFFL